jgi:CDP-glucose 4,6-dehydratase
MDWIAPLKIDFAVFKGKRILVTGHTGFKGSWLYKILEIAGAELDGFSLPPEANAHINSLKFESRIGPDQFGDIRNFDEIRSKVVDFDPQVVFHLAAQPLVRKSFVETRETFETNFMGGVNLLESLRDRTKLEALIFITSDKAYENVEWEWGYRENDQVGGIDPYSASKGAVEIAFASYARSIFNGRDIKMATTRAGNVIGGGDWSEDRIVPDSIRSVQNQTPVVLRNPNSTRPWQHVLEPLSGYLRLAEVMLKGGNVKSAYNFGPNLTAAHNVEEVVRGIFGVIGEGELQVERNSSNVHEANLLQLNCDRAKQDLSWQPRWGFERTIAETANWYKAYLENKSMNEITEHQIREYFKELN